MPVGKDRTVNPTQPREAISIDILYFPKSTKGHTHGLLIADLLEDSPSLKSYLREILAKCYLDARNLLIDETKLDASIFPLEVLASLEEILDQNWLPDFGET